MRAMRERIPAALPDKRAHCLAAGLIALHCSAPEAYIAGYGKELADLVDGGDAEWADIRADERGIRCARSDPSDVALAVCCAAATAAGGAGPGSAGAAGAGVGK